MATKRSPRLNGGFSSEWDCVGGRANWASDSSKPVIYASVHQTDQQDTDLSASNQSIRRCSFQARSTTPLADGLPPPPPPKKKGERTSVNGVVVVCWSFFLCVSFPFRGQNMRSNCVFFGRGRDHGEDGAVHDGHLRLRADPQARGVPGLAQLDGRLLVQVHHRLENRPAGFVFVFVFPPFRCCFLVGEGGGSTPQPHRSPRNENGRAAFLVGGEVHPWFSLTIPTNNEKRPGGWFLFCLFWGVHPWFWGWLKMKPKGKPENLAVRPVKRHTHVWVPSDPLLA